jgi:hypothetical protein
LIEAQPEQSHPQCLSESATGAGSEHHAWATIVEVGESCAGERHCETHRERRSQRRSPLDLIELSLYFRGREPRPRVSPKPIQSAETRGVNTVAGDSDGRRNILSGGIRCERDAVERKINSNAIESYGR